MKTRTALLCLLLLFTICRSADAAKSFVDSKLERMIIPEVDLVDTTVADFFEFITELVREVDPEPDKRKKGVNIVLDLENQDKRRKVTWQGKNKSVKRIVEDVCLRAGLSYSVHNNIVWISSQNRIKQWLETRRYNIPVSKTLAIRQEGVKTYFTKRGVPFPDGAYCLYIRGKGQIMAKNTKKNLDLLRKVLYAKSAGGSHDDRISRLKGGAFAGQPVYSMRGGKLDKRLGGTADEMRAKQRDSRTRHMKDMEVYEKILQQRADAREQEALARKLDQVVIPQLELNKTSVRDSLRLLEEIAFEFSKTSSKGQAGFQAILRISPQEAAHPVTFRAKNIPLMQAVRAILSATGLRYRLHGASLIVYSDKNAGATRPM